MRARIGIFAALALALTLGLLAFSTNISAQEAPASGSGTMPGCAPDETCVDPVPPCDLETLCVDEPPPCEPMEICQGVPIDCPDNDPDVMCAQPIDCPTDAPCAGPDCPPDTPCTEPGCPADVPDCAFPEPVPPPCDPADARECQFNDTDSDGWLDFTEEAWGSNPNDASSTPEHGYLYETCIDGVDNDGDGAIDSGDDGCRIDSDGDGLIDSEDNCPWDSNADQADRDGDGVGDACDYDADNDSWDDFIEAEWGSNPDDANSTPEHWFAIETCEDGRDNDGDAATDAADRGCAPDNDYDGIADASDNCPTYWNPEQTDSDGDGTGDACVDSDGDGFFDGDEVGWGSDADDPNSVPEGGVNWEACSDGIDNDRDGTLDGDDEGCRVMAEDGAAPPLMPSSGGPVAVADQGGPPGASPVAESETSVTGLPAAGTGIADSDSPLWLTYAMFGALGAIAGSATLYRAYARKRS